MSLHPVSSFQLNESLNELDFSWIEDRISCAQLEILDYLHSNSFLMSKTTDVLLGKVNINQTEVSIFQITIFCNVVFLSIEELVTYFYPIQTCCFRGKISS